MANRCDLRMKICKAIHEATDQYGTAAGIAAEKILAIPEIRDALNKQEREARPKVRLLPVMPSQRGGLARAAQKATDNA